MSKPTRYPQSVLFRASVEEHEYLKYEAEKYDVPMAEILRQCIALRKNSSQSKDQDKSKQ